MFGLLDLKFMSFLVFLFVEAAHLLRVTALPRVQTVTSATFTEIKIHCVSHFVTNMFPGRMSSQMPHGSLPEFPQMPKCSPDASQMSHLQGGPRKRFLWSPDAPILSRHNLWLFHEV